MSFSYHADDEECLMTEREEMRDRGGGGDSEEKMSLSKMPSPPSSLLTTDEQSPANAFTIFLPHSHASQEGGWGKARSQGIGIGRQAGRWFVLEWSVPGPSGR